MPLRSMRCFIHAGVGALGSMPSMIRPTNRGQAAGSSTRTSRRMAEATGTGAAAGGTSGAPVTAATSRAMPSSDRQSARLGVSFSVISVSSSASASRSEGADRRIGGQGEQARRVVVDAEFLRRAQHPLRRDPAYGGRLDRHAARKQRADQRAGHLHAGRRVGRAAHDGQRRAGTGVDRAQAQPVGVGMRRHRLDPRHDDARKRRRRRRRLLDLEPGHRQPLAKRCRVELRIDQRAQPML